jgi:hypothetical protein
VDEPPVPAVVEPPLLVLGPLPESPGWITAPAPLDGPPPSPSSDPSPTSPTQPDSTAPMNVAASATAHEGVRVLSIRRVYAAFDACSTSTDPASLLHA